MTLYRDKTYDDGSHYLSGEVCGLDGEGNFRVLVPVEEPVFRIERCGHGRIDPHTFWIDYTRTGPQPSPTQPHQSAVQCDGGIVVRVGDADDT